jgi:hypothetical protein
LNQQGSGHIDPEFNHYQESLKLLTTISSHDVDAILIALLREFLAQLESSSTVGFPGMGAMAKELAFLALADSQLTCNLLLPALCHQSSEIINLGLDLFWTVVKKEIERAQLDSRLTTSLLPIIIKLSKTNSKAKTLLDNLLKKLRISQLSQTFISIFSKDKRTRMQAYINIFKLEFFDTCLNFTSPIGIVTDANVVLPGVSSSILAFTDPLDGIVDSHGRVAFVEKLAAFPDKSSQRGRITQAQIKSLFELLNIALNRNLEFNVRGVALDQISEAIYFYCDSQALKDFSNQLLIVCRDNLNEFGSKRENFSMLLASLKPLDESFISSKSATDLPIQNKYYEQEKILAVKFLTLYNSIIHHYKHLGTARLTELESLFTHEKNKGCCRALWILSTEKEVSHRFQAFLLLNLIFISGNSILSMLKSNSLEQKLSTEERGTGCYPIFDFISSEFYVLYKGVSINAIENQHPLRNISTDKQDHILAFIESFTELSASKENRHLAFNPEVNREKIAGYLVEDRLTKCLKVFSLSIKANGQSSSLAKWANVAQLASYMGRTEFFEQKTNLEAQFNLMKELLSQGKDDLFLEYNSTLTSLLKSRLFKQMYSHQATLKNFLEWTTLFYHTKLLPLIYEIHVEAFTEKHDLILGILALMTTTVRQAMTSNDQKLLITIRGFITAPSFLEFLSDILRKYEAMDVVSTTLVEFMRWHFDLFLRSEGESKYQECVQFMFDSSLICNRTDNFLGIKRLYGILKLAHNMVTRNLLLTAGDCKPLFEDVKDMRNEDVLVPTTFKTSTIAWIVSLLDHRCISVRMLCWNLVINYFDSTLLELFPSIIDNAISTLNLINESSGVLSLCYFFLFKCSRLIVTFDSLGTIDKPLGRLLSREEFVRKVHERKTIETVRRIIAQESCPPMLLGNCVRFIIQWYSLDPHSVVNKHFHSDFLDKLLLHLNRIDDLELNVYELEKVKFLTERLSCIGVLLNFLIITSRGNSNNCHVLMKNFSLIEVILGWLALCGHILKAPIHLQGEFQRDTTASLHHKTLQASVTELAKNGIHLLEVMVFEDKDTFLYYLEEHEDNQPSEKRLFSVIADLLTQDSSSSSMGYSLLKLTSKVLLSWDRGYQLLDRDNSASQIAECLSARCMQFFKSIDYLKISDSDYLKIIGSEEIIHILAVIVAKSDIMKEKVLVSGLFQLYVTKFLQIIRSFKKDINFITPSHKKDNTFMSIKVPSNHSKSLISTETSKKPIGKGTKIKQETELPTQTTRLNQNIRQITANSSGHIKSYILVAKYFFHNALKSNSLSKASADLLETKIGDLMEIVNFLWVEGQADDVVKNYKRK